MIDQEQLPAYVEKYFPGISQTCNDKENNAYVLIKQVVSYVVKELSRRNYEVVGKCFEVVDNLYNNGSTVVKTAIENVFVYSFSYSFYYDKKQRDVVMKLVPLSLQQLYRSQMINSHL